MEELILQRPTAEYAQQIMICEKPELLGMTNHLLFVGETEISG